MHGLPAIALTLMLTMDAHANNVEHAEGLRPGRPPALKVYMSVACEYPRNEQYYFQR